MLATISSRPTFVAVLPTFRCFSAPNRLDFAHLLFDTSPMPAIPKSYTLWLTLRGVS
jgi:hypothetical protein